jgi:hypothetical protein
MVLRNMFLLPAVAYVYMTGKSIVFCESCIRSGVGMKIKFGKVLIEVPNEKCFETMFSRPNPEFFRDLFKLTYSSFTNYLKNVQSARKKYTKTGKSDKSEDE